MAMQQHMVQQVAFSAIPDAVKIVSWASDILGS
jgi:hypothetical protein